MTEIPFCILVRLMAVLGFLTLELLDAHLPKTWAATFLLTEVEEYGCKGREVDIPASNVVSAYYSNMITSNK